MHQLLRTEVGLNRSWISQMRTRYRGGHRGGRSQPRPGWLMTGWWPDSDWRPPLRWEGSPRLPSGPVTAQIRDWRSTAAQHSLISQCAADSVIARWQETLEKVAEDWLLILTLPRWFTLLRMLILLDMTELSWIWVLVPGGVSVPPSPAQQMLTRRSRGQASVSPVWASSALIVRLVSHEPISPLSAKRGFWNTEDISCSLTHKYFSNDLQLVTFGNIQLNFSFFDKMMLVLILERN